MRTTLNISFPDDLYLFISERVDAGSFASTGEYIRSLVRDDYSRCGGSKRERPTPRGPRRVHDMMIDPAKGSGEY